MAKKSSVVGRKSLEPKSSQGSTESRPTRLKSSSLLDTRVVYCGDNLEQLAKLPDACARQMMKEECRIMKLAPSLFLHSSFILLPSPVTASHNVNVMRIFGKNDLKN